MIDDLGVGFNQINIMTILYDAVLLYPEHLVSFVEIHVYFHLYFAVFCLNGSTTFVKFLYVCVIFFNQ